MTKPATIFDKLAAPFDPKDVEWRVGSMKKDKTAGMALAYVDARAVMERLDEVCGPGGWQCRYSHAEAKTVCEIGIRVGDEWLWKANGAGDTDIEAQKGALSDSFKRAAVMWGIGRYLYDVQSPWVKVTPFKTIDPSEFARLRKILPARIEAAEDRPATDDTPARHAVAYAPPAPPAEPAKPYAIRVPATPNGSDWVAWGKEYTDHMRAIRNVNEGYAWIDANAPALATCDKEAPKIAARIKEITKQAMDAVDGATPDNGKAAA